MTHPAAAAEIVTSSSSAKLIVSGSSAEQPSPASPNASTPTAVLPSEREAVSTNATARTNGSSRYVRSAGNCRWIDAKSTRPSVTIAQNVVRVRDATAVEAPSSVVMSIWDQLPFIVSHSPYSTANPAYNQKRDGMPRGRPASSEPTARSP